MITVVKIGGNVIDSEQNLSEFLTHFSKIEGKKILIHGGGKIATQLGATMGIESKMVDGRRITDQETLKLVTMVYGGLINKSIVASLQAKGANAIGLTGADAQTVTAIKRPVKTIDYGFVGDITQVNGKTIYDFLENRLCPVFAPLTCTSEGQMLNTNADTMASAIAVGLAKHEEVNLVYCFEKNGVLKDANNNDSVIPEIDYEYYQKLKVDKVIFDGMIPKLDNAFNAIKEGVAKVIICHASQVLNYKNTGTQLK